jgi:site-specific DNA recombinase
MRSRISRSRKGARHRKAAKRGRKAARNESKRRLKRRKNFALQAQTVRGPRSSDARLLVALCCCLAILVVVSSTVFPQALDTTSLAALSALVPAPPCCGRRRNRKADAEVSCRDVAASYARFSSDQQDAKSIGDQQRPCRERAERDGNHIPDDLQFADEAVSGTKLSRDGFDRMLKAAEEGRFKTLYFFDLSRLARESVITITTLKKLVYVHKVRVVSVTEGIDSANDGWFTLATILGLQHEQYLKTLRANVLRGLIGNLIDELSLGDHCFGYSSVPIEGAPLRGKGRNARPPKKYVIDEEEEKWVRRIFDWYVRDRQPIQWIVRELNRQKAPKDHRNAKTKWGRSGVRALLRRIKYIGIWPWGITTNCRDPLTGQIYKELRPEEETEGWIRRFPHLQIVDDETFAEAQLRLDKNEEDCAAFRGDEGKLTGSPKGASGPRHLLQGRIRCSGCGSSFYVGGARGQYLICPAFRNGLCNCRTMLPRELAKRLILEEIGQRILSDEAWRRAVHEQALKAWNDFESTIPAELSAAQKQLAAVEQKIVRMVDQIEDGLDDPDVKNRLADRRKEKEQIARNIAKLRNATTSRPPKPTNEWMDEQLKNLQEVLSSGTPAAAIALGNLIGDVMVTEVSRPGRKRPFLRGEFVLRTRSVVNVLIRAHGSESSDAAAGQDAADEKITVEFVEPDPKYEMSDRVKELSDQGLVNWEIAEKLDLHRSRVTLFFNFWFERRGLPVPNRQERPKRKQRQTPLYKRLADEAKQRWEAGESESAIGRDFETTQATVRNAIKWWHTSRNLPVPKFADRRKTQVGLAASLYEAGCTITEIAEKKLEVSITTVRKMLDEWFASKGEVRPDGRSRRRLSA